MTPGIVSRRAVLGGHHADVQVEEEIVRPELQTVAVTGVSEYTIEIDGQSVRWKGQQQPWVPMVWPNPQGVPGSRITAFTPDGRKVVVLE